MPHISSCQLASKKERLVFRSSTLAFTLLLQLTALLRWLYLPGGEATINTDIPSSAASRFKNNYLARSITQASAVLSLGPPYSPSLLLSIVKSTKRFWKSFRQNIDTFRRANDLLFLKGTILFQLDLPLKCNLRYVYVRLFMSLDLLRRRFWRASLEAVLPLEPDGSFDLRHIKKLWNLETCIVSSFSACVHSTV